TNAELIDGRFDAYLPIPPCALDTALRVKIHTVASVDGSVASVVRSLVLHGDAASGPASDIDPPEAAILGEGERLDDTTHLFTITLHDSSGIGLPMSGSGVIPQWQLEGGAWHDVLPSEMSWNGEDSRTAIMKVKVANLGPGYHHLQFRVTDLVCNVREVGSLLTVDMPSAGEDVAVRAYPNPTAGDLHVRMAHAALEGADFHWRLLNMQGRMLKESGAISSCCKETELHIDRGTLNGIPSGIYFLEIIISPSLNRNETKVIKIPVALIR
ncbi:MAG: hypothetical protein ABI876_05925, partial [Bacteroidota bacterium]